VGKRPEVEAYLLDGTALEPDEAIYDNYILQEYVEIFSLFYNHSKARRRLFSRDTVPPYVRPGPPGFRGAHVLRSTLEHFHICLIIIPSPPSLVPSPPSFLRLPRPFASLVPSPPSSLRLHRLFAYSNKSWSDIGHSLFALKEMNQMEPEMCGYLD
jgi:hypothetical protein